MTLLHRFIIASALLLLTACSSTPATRYYVLQPGINSAEKTVSDSIGVGPIRVADYLERDGISRTEGSQLMVSDYDRWSEPLKAGITRTLIENISALTNNDQVVGFPWRRDEAPRYALRIYVLQLDSDASQASLKVKWTVFDNDNNSSVGQGMDTFTAPTSDNYSSQVEAYNQLLAQLSRKLVTALPE